MIDDTELDLIVRTFVAEGRDRAPQRDITAALTQVATTRQRKPRPWSPDVMAQTPGARLLLVAGVVLILAAGIAIGVGATFFRTPVAPPEDPPSAPSPAVAPGPLSLVPFAADDWAVRLKIPAGWSAIGPNVSEYRHFGGDEPEGHLSVTNENPYGTTICSPDCVDFQVPLTIPYDPAAQLASLKASIGAIAGGNEWRDLPAAVLRDLQGGSRLDTTTDVRGSEWRRVHVVGLKGRNVVAIAWSQPAAVFDEKLLDSILDGIVLMDAPVHTDGDLLPHDGKTFTMSVPGVWSPGEQPTLDGDPLSGVRSDGESHVVVSIGAPDGTFGWCDPGCREFTNVTSLDALEAVVRGFAKLGPSTSITLDGELARSMKVTSPVARTVAIAMHDGRPVGILIDDREGIAAPWIFDQMIGSFAFVDPVVEPPDQVLTTAGGRVTVGLSAEWQPSSDDDGIFVNQNVRMTVRAGADDGSITTCGTPAGPWELCRAITPASLDELADAVQPLLVADRGIGPPIRVRDRTTLGGEPAVITRIQAYEPPARGGQEVVYIVAMHDHRPYIVRIRTTANEVRGVESIIAGFAFVD